MLEQGADTGFVLGYGSWCTLRMRHGSKAGSLEGGTTSSTQLIPLDSASYSRSQSVPMQSTFSVGFNDEVRSPIRTGYGVWAYNGSLSFDFSAPMRDLIFTKKQEFFQRNSFLDITLCDGEGMIEIPGAVWNSFSISASENQLVNGSLGFASCNGYVPDIQVTKNIPGRRNYVDLPELQPYWQYGRDGVTAFTLNISRSVTPIYLNEKDWAGPAYLRVGMLDVSADVTCWEEWQLYHKFSLGTKSIEFQGMYATSKAWNFAGLGGNGTKTYQLNAYGLESASRIFVIS